MGLHGVLGDKHAFGDLPVAQALGDQLQDLQLAFGHPNGCQSVVVPDEAGRHRRRDFLDDDPLFPRRDSEAEPNPDGDEDEGDESTVDFDGVVQDEVAVLNGLEERDQRASQEAVEENWFAHTGMWWKRASLAIQDRVPVSGRARAPRCWKVFGESRGLGIGRAQPRRSRHGREGPVWR